MADEPINSLKKKKKINNSFPAMYVVIYDYPPMEDENFNDFES